jgi:hypothetical protein
MAAILVYIPGGKINKWAYEGALQQVEAIKEEFKGNIIDLGSIGIPEFYNKGEELSESVHQQASKFVELAKSGQNVIARINARDQLEAFYYLAFAAPTDQVLHPKQLIVLSAKCRPMTEEEWRHSIGWTVYVVRQSLKEIS